MSIKTDIQLAVDASQIQNETASNANTSTRVGAMFNNLVDNKINQDKIVVVVTGASDTNIPSEKSVKTYADTKQTALGYTAENSSNKDTDVALTANSDTKYPSQKAAKAYADTKQAFLVSATNIKTINGSSLLGGGDLIVSTSKGYKEYRARISQAGTNSIVPEIIFIDEISFTGSGINDPLFKLIQFSRSSIGNYTLLIKSNDTNVININKCDISFSDAKIRVTGATSTASSPLQTCNFPFSSYQANGTISDDVIIYSNVYVRIYL